MKVADWKDIAELFGIAAIVASLVFVGLEMKQSQEIALNEVAAAHEASEIELYVAIRSDWPVWLKGNAGGDLDPSEREIYRNLIDLSQWRHQNVWEEFRRYGLELPMKVVVADFVAFLRSNPGAREVWTEMANDRMADRRKLIPGYKGSSFNIAVYDALARLDDQ